MHAARPRLLLLVVAGLAALLVLVQVLPVVRATPAVLQTSCAKLLVSETDGALVSLSVNSTKAGSTWVELASSVASGTGPSKKLSWWTVTIATAQANRQQYLTSTLFTKFAGVSGSGTSQLVVTWDSTLSQYGGQVKATISAASADACVFDVAFDVALQCGQSCGVWQLDVSLPVVRVDSATELLWPRGFGELYTDPATSATSLNALYPGSATMQWLSECYAQYGRCLYFGAHDAAGTTKILHHLVQPMEQSAVSVSVTLYAENQGGSPSASFHATSFGFSADGLGTWSEAANVYRTWALAEAQWTQAGPISKRASFPTWLIDNQMWVNSGWQFHDVFNVSQGDPSVVCGTVPALAAKLGDTVALHWYVWDEIAFDTNYPEYFPAKPGFAQCVQQLQKAGVHVVPYINGRIWDVNTAAWKSLNAVGAAAKQCAVQHNPSPGALSIYAESYGSGASFAVMCPATSLWQSAIGGTAQTLRQNYSTHGVYIDQVAAADAKLCQDPSHGHTTGGGSYWRDGYVKLLSAAQAGGAGEFAVVTESNSETFMDQVHGYLTLPAFGLNYTGPVRVAPAFPAIYGGYMIAFGQVFIRDDFVPDPTVFAAKVAQMFVYGAQLGWMSLGGTQDFPPMGVYDLMMDDKYAPQVSFMAAVAKLRRAAVNYVVHGRLLSVPDLAVKSATGRDADEHHRSPNQHVLIGASDDVESGAHVGAHTQQAHTHVRRRASLASYLQYPPVAGALWARADGAAAGLLLARAVNSPAVVSVTQLDVRGAFAGAAPPKLVDAYVVTPQSRTPLFSGQPAQAVGFTLKMPALSSVVVEFVASK